MFLVTNFIQKIFWKYFKILIALISFPNFERDKVNKLGEFKSLKCVKNWLDI